MFRYGKRLTGLLFAVALGGVFALAPVCADDAGSASNPDTLRNLAIQRNIHIGAAVQSSLLKDPNYATTLARDFNMLVAENDMKFETTEPKQNTFNFGPGDAIVQFAQENRMTVRGHCLVWHQQVPGWVTNGNWKKDELLEIMRNHITQMVQHYRGKVACWDVVNEAVDDQNNLRRTIWYNAIGKEYIDEAFKAAHQADPDAELFYNDYGGEGSNSKSDAIYQLVKGMKKRGVPIDGVGLQMHIDTSGYPLNNGLKSNIERYTKLGLKVQITELDVRVPMPATEKDLKKQAQIYHDLMAICLQDPNVTAFVLWGFTDKYTWIPQFAPWPGMGQPLIFDENYRNKPAYTALQNALKGL